MWTCQPPPVSTPVPTSPQPTGERASLQSTDGRAVRIRRTASMLGNLDADVAADNTPVTIVRRERRTNEDPETVLMMPEIDWAYVVTEDGTKQGYVRVAELRAALPGTRVSGWGRIGQEEPIPPPGPSPLEQAEMLRAANNAEQIAHVLLSQGQGDRASQLMATAQQFRLNTQNMRLATTIHLPGLRARVVRPGAANIYDEPNGRAVGVVPTGTELIAIGEAAAYLDPKVAYLVANNQPVPTAAFSAHWFQVVMPSGEVLPNSVVRGAWIRASDVSGPLKPLTAMPARMGQLDASTFEQQTVLQTADNAEAAARVLLSQGRADQAAQLMATAQQLRLNVQNARQAVSPSTPDALRALRNAGVPSINRGVAFCNAPGRVCFLGDGPEHAPGSDYPLDLRRAMPNGTRVRLFQNMSSRRWRRVYVVQLDDGRRGYIPASFLVDPRGVRLA